MVAYNAQKYCELHADEVKVDLKHFAFTLPDLKWSECVWSVHI